jgi:glycosyltransferase involved in cell wall biosynthesis
MIKIVSCFWNVGDYITKCIDSVMNQDFKDFKMFLIDDVSNDDTINVIKEKIKDDKRFVLIPNTEKKYKLKNIDDLLIDEDLFDDEDIIIELDGDDWLENNKVLSLINEKYNQNKNLWITNGSFVYSDGRFGFSSKVNPETIRTDTFLFSHLRTWKVHLWRNIKQESFLDENGEYFKAAPDAAYSFPMVEMAGERHYEYIPNILYVYNESTPYNEHKSGASAGQFEQFRCSNIIRNLPKYQKL